MKTCPRCNRPNGDESMMCRCGHSFVTPVMSDERRRHREHKRRGDLGCFVWLFVVQGLGWLLIGAALFFLPTSPDVLDPAAKDFGGLLLAALSLPYFYAAWAVSHRKKHAYPLAMVLCGLGILNVPVGTAISIFLMMGMARHRHLLTH